MTSIRCLLLAALCVCGFTVSLSQAAEESVAWRRHDIDPANFNPSGAIFDVNKDGRPDILAGRFWYESPSWKRHFVRDVEVIRGRQDDYSSLPLDVDRDGWTDLVSVNYRSKSLYWVAHPGEPLKRPWARHVIDTPGPSETGRLEDIDADGRLDVLPHGTNFAAWYSVSLQKGEEGSGRPIWLRHDLPKPLAGHGLGFGDMNADGRRDVVGPTGWAESPEDRRGGRWVWHAGPQLDRDVSNPILVHDVDGDGDNDLVWGRGHNIGLYWLENLGSDTESEIAASGERQLPDSTPDSQTTTDSLKAARELSGNVQTDDREIRWRRRAIDTSWSQPHALLLADISGDGRLDLVAGKRYMGHDGKDPGEYDPLIVAWYDFDISRKTWRRHLVSESMDAGFGLDPKCVDVDGDDDVDILCAGRSGLFLMENLRVASGEPSSDEKTAKPPATAPLRIEPQTYDDHTNLLVVKDYDGKSRPVENPSDWALRRAQVLKSMQQVMGPLPGSAKRVPLRARVVKSEQAEGYTRHTIRYDAEPSDDGFSGSVPALLLVPDNIKGQAPAMLCLHPTSALGKAQVAGLGGRPSRFYAHELARRGYVCLVPDYPSFGEYEDYDFAADDYASGSMKAIWDNIRGVDLLQSLEYVHPDRIGVIGHSLGGHNALFTACFDQRIRAVVTSCGFTAFADYYGGDLQGWTSERYMPRIRDVYESDPARMPFDFPEVLAAIAPRPVFISAPQHDSNFDVGGVKKCVAAAGDIYRLRGRERNLHAVHPHCGHDFPDSIRDAVYAWLDEQLK